MEFILATKVPLVMFAPSGAMTQNRSWPTPPAIKSRRSNHTEAASYSHCVRATPSSTQ